MTNTPFRKMILEECREWIGTPYCHQASVKMAGCDCLGLLRGVWRKLYQGEPQALPAYTADWGEVDQNEHLLKAATSYLLPGTMILPASVILFRWRPDLPVKHLGIVASERSFFHAYERAGVVETTLGPHWRSKIAASFEFPENYQGQIS